MTAATKMPPLPSTVETPAHMLGAGTLRLQRQDRILGVTHFLPRTWTPCRTQLAKRRAEPRKVKVLRHRRTAGRDKLKSGRKKETNGNE